MSAPASTRSPSTMPIRPARSTSALSVAARFGLSSNDAKSIAAEVGTAVAAWRTTAKRFKLTTAQIERMASAFDHTDLAAAISGSISSSIVKTPK